MNWNEQVKILNKNINQITTELHNFEKHTGIIDFVKKFNNINYEILINYVEIDLNSNNFNFTFNTPYPNIQTNKTNIKQKDFLVGDKKIKRKNLLKKIHPDKLDFTI